LPGIVLGALSRILSNDIAGRGRPEINMYIALITVAVNIIANIVLIPRMGINGAALATTLSYSFNTVLKIIAYSMVSGLKWYKIFFISNTDNEIFSWKTSKYFSTKDIIV